MIDNLFEIIEIAKSKNEAIEREIKNRRINTSVFRRLFGKYSK